MRTLGQYAGVKVALAATLQPSRGDVGCNYPSSLRHLGSFEWGRGLNNPEFVNAGGIKTRYFQAGEGEPVVLVHGLQFGDPGASALHWEPVFHRFAQAFHVYALDKIGQGYSDNPKQDQDYVIGTTVRHLYNFLEAVGVPGAHVVGHSKGGYTVCRLALEHPEVVKTLVIVDSATLMVPMAKFHDDLDKKAAPTSDLRERTRLKLATSYFRSDHITEEYLDTVMEIGKRPSIQEAGAKMKGPLRARFFSDLDARRAETHDWIRRGGLKVPTLLVWVKNNASFPVETVGVAAMNLILPHNPRSEMHILNETGHDCFWEQPKAFVAAVSSFIMSG